MVTRRIEKTDNGYDLIVFGTRQYVEGKDAVISELLQRLLLIKGELLFDFPSLAYNAGVGVPVFDKLNQFELDLEIRRIILSIPEIYNIKKYTSSVIKNDEGKNIYLADFQVDTSEGEVTWQITV